MLRKLMRRASTLQSDQSGATAIEYALIASGIAAVLIGIVYSTGGSVTALFVAVRDAL